MALYKGRELPKVLYHYTTKASCLSIIKNGKLWHTSCADVADNQDMKLGIDALKAAAIKRDNKRDLSFKLLPLFDFFQKDFFIQCYCPAPNNRELWKKYANKDGTPGVAIGFNTEKLYKLLKVQGVVLAPVAYDRGDKRERLCKRVEKLKNFSEIHDLTVDALLIKRDSLRHEREIRTIYTDGLNGVVGGSVLTRDYKGLEIKYVSLNISDGERGIPVERIVVANSELKSTLERHQSYPVEYIADSYA